MDHVSWRKSSYSAGNGGQCVEVTSWRKSSRSASNGGACVEIATRQPGVVAVRDSKDPHGPALAVAPGRWRDFLAEVKAGRPSSSWG
jgi:Domain of unknown function (DUF397)